MTSRRAGTVTVSGINGERIVQKNVPLCFPRWVTRTEVKRQDGTLQQVICDKPATLVYPANQACAEMHAFRRPALPSLHGVSSFVMQSTKYASSCVRASARSRRGAHMSPER